MATGRRAVSVHGDVASCSPSTQLPGIAQCLCTTTGHHTSLCTVTWDLNTYLTLTMVLKPVDGGVVQSLCMAMQHHVVSRTF